MPRGRGAWKIRTGLFIKEYLEKHGEAYISEIHKAYKEAWQGENAIRPKAKRVRTCTYESFGKYFRNLVKLELVEFSREEAMEYAPPGGELLTIQDNRVVPSVRRYYRLTDKGQAEEDAWFDPLHYRRIAT